MNSVSWHKKGLAFFNKRSQLQKKILAGGFWAVIIKGFSIPLNLAVVGLLARLLSPEEMGGYFLAFSLVTAASSLGMLGMGDTMVRLVASSIAIGDNSTARRAIRESFSWGGAGAFVAAVVMLLFGATFGLPANAVILVALWGITQTGQNLLAEALRSFNDIRLATIFQNRSISNAIIAVILFIVWFSEMEIDLLLVLSIIVIINTSADFLGFISLWWKMKVEIPLHSNQASGPPLRIFSQALPVFGIASMNMIKAQIGIWIVAAYLSTQEIALYGSATRLVYFVSVPLATVVNALIPPIIAELYAKRQIAKLESTVRGLATVASIAALVLTLIFIVGGELALRIIFGEFYAGAWLVLGILAIAELIGVAGGSCGVTLVMTGHQKTLMGITVISTILSIIMTFIGIKYMGMVGVAIATALAVLFQNVLMVLSSKKTVGIWTHVKLSWK